MNDFDNKQICLYKDIERFGFTCDVCGRKVNGCYIVNGMKFCAKCYQETFGKYNQQNEIQQLKQQLEEKEKEIEDMDKDLVFNANEIKRLIQEKKQLKQNQTQLAIKELEDVKKQIDNLYIYSFKGKSEIGDELISSEELIEIIDKRIQELKGG